MRSRSNSGVKLDNFARLVHKTLLVNQDPITGLYPSNDAFDHAWVRDNLYTVQGKMFALNFFFDFFSRTSRISPPNLETELFLYYGLSMNIFATQFLKISNYFSYILRKVYKYEEKNCVLCRINFCDEFK